METAPSEVVRPFHYNVDTISNPHSFQESCLNSASCDGKINEKIFSYILAPEKGKAITQGRCNIYMYVSSIIITEKVWIEKTNPAPIVWSAEPLTEIPLAGLKSVKSYQAECLFWFNS